MTDINPHFWGQQFQVRADDADPKYLADHLAAMSRAHLGAYQRFLTGPGHRERMSREAVREATTTLWHPAYAAFVGTALLRGWTVERIHQAVDDGGSMDEWLYQWLGEAGLTDDQIDALSINLSAGRDVCPACEAANHGNASCETCHLRWVEEWGHNHSACATTPRAGGDPS